VQANKGSSDFQRRWFGQYVGMASSKAALDKLAALLDGKDVIEGLPIDQDLRWAIISRLNRFDYPGSLALIEAEQARDKSDSGQAAALAATVVRPDPKLKAEWLAKVEDLQTKLPFSKVRTAMGSLYPAEQASLNEQTAAARLAKLGDIDKVAGPVYMRSFAASMIPATCTPASVKRLASAVSQLKDLSAGTRRALLNTHEEDKRCVAIKQAMTVPST
jgi:aminopeptidase N